MVWMTTSQVICQCGALYERTEFHKAPRADSFICTGCGHTLEVFSDCEWPNSASTATLIVAVHTG
jgi:hypothetical protein